MRHVLQGRFTAMIVGGEICYDWVSSEKGKTSETGRSAELAFVQRDWSWARQAGLETSMH